MTKNVTGTRNLSLRDAYAVGADDIVDRLGVAPDNGLTAAEVYRRQRQFGPNSLRESRPKSVWLILYDQFRSIIVVLLGAAAGLSLLFGNWTEGVAIIAVIVINTVIGFLTELRAIRSMEALRRLSVLKAKVRRDGRLQEIQSKQLVPGDIVILEAGDIVAADLRLLQASKFQCDESILTGESMPVAKGVGPLAPGTILPERTNMAFQGTAITSGAGEGVVVATAMSTELGQISALVEQAEAQTTPLEKRLAFLSRQLVWITLALAAVIGVVGILGGKPPLLMIETAIALAVAAVPEGLPMVATLALARGMWRMARRNALIERLPAVETLGATTVILTDKTGTLTENRMTVTRLALPGMNVDVTSAGFEKDRAALDPVTVPAIGDALRVGVLCNNASLSQDTAGAGVIGDPMEGALLAAGQLAGLARDDLLRSLPEVREIAFDPDLRMMATVHKAADGYLFAVKGAPEAVIEAADTIMIDGERRLLSRSDRDYWHARAEEFAASGLRMLALASKTADDRNAPAYRNLTFLGLAGLHDPPRGGVAASIETCKRAGIGVVMVTGDHAVTAGEIARTVGLADPHSPPPSEGRALEAIDALSDAERARLLRIPVFARVSPRQKLDLISLHQSAGAVVAMTGDGVNDAPALRQADIGIAMGRRGSQVAREAADVVLQDDAFETIVAAIAQGRVIFSNIRKFILYLLSCNLSEIMIVGLASLSGMPLPIFPLQILYLNLVTDVFPAFALGAGEGERNVMDGPPRDPRESLLPTRLWLAIAVYGATITLATLAAFVLAMRLLEQSAASAVTVAFITLALAQLWHVFNMRNRYSSLVRNEITRNPYVWGALVLCTGLVLAAVYLPGLSGILSLSHPTAAGWGIAVSLSFLPLILGQVAKLILPARAKDRTRAV